MSVIKSLGFLAVTFIALTSVATAEVIYHKNGTPRAMGHSPRSSFCILLADLNGLGTFRRDIPTQVMRFMRQIIIENMGLKLEHE